MNSPRTALSPPQLIRNGFDWSGKTARLPYIIVALATLALTALIPVTRNFSGANTIVFVALTMLFPIWLGHTRRRLRDAGWSGWLIWVALLPIVGLLLTIFLAFKPGDDLYGEERGPYSRLGFAVALICGALFLSRAFWAPYWIPSGSMKPNLLVGDFVAAAPVNEPRRGDIIVFNHPSLSFEVISRLIGLPGEEIQVKGGVVHVNGVALAQTQAGTFREVFKPQGQMQVSPRCRNAPEPEGVCEKTRKVEGLPEGRSHAILDIGRASMDDTGVYEVPEGYYFFLGDNRDNANDSRFDPAQGGLGLVPRDNLTGRVVRVLFSSAGDHLLHVWTWRSDRFMRRLE